MQGIKFREWVNEWMYLSESLKARTFAKRPEIHEIAGCSTKVCSLKSRICRTIGCP